MSRNVSLALLAITLTLALLTIHVAHAQTIQLVAYGYWMGMASPGSTLVPLKVVVLMPPEVPSSYFAYDIKVKLSLPSGIQWYSKEQTCKIPMLKPGKNYTCIFYLSIPPTTKPGLYTIKVKLDYVLYNTTYVYGRPVFVYLKEVEQTVDLTLPVVGNAGISVYSALLGMGKVQYVGPGAEDVPLTVYLLNTGTSTLLNVTVHLILKYPLYAKRNGKIVHVLTKTIGALPPGRPVPVTFIVDIYSNVTGGCYTETLNITVGTTNMWNLTKTFTICIPTVNITALGASWLVPDMELVGPGADNVPLEITLLSTSTIRNVNVCLPLGYPLYRPGKKMLCKYLPVIPAYEPTKIVYIVDIRNNATKGTYTVPLLIRFGTVIIRKNVTVTIPYPKIRILYAMTYPPVVFPGTDNVLLNVTLVNAGTGTARNVTVKLVLPRGFTAPTPNTTKVTIPAVVPGKPIPLVFVFNVPDSVKPGVYELKLDVKYGSADTYYVIYLKVYEKPVFKVIKIETVKFYPGASSALLRVWVKYVSGPTLYGVQAILSMPNVFTFHVPSNNPLAAMYANRIVLGKISPGQVFQLDYLVDIDSAAVPGPYNMTLMLMYIPAPMLPYMAKLGKNFEMTSTLHLTVRVYTTLQVEAMKHLPEIVCAIIIVVAIIAIAVSRRRRRRA